MNTAALFFVAVMWNLLGVCAALGISLDTKQVRPVDLRHGFLLLAITLAGILVRGEPFQWVAWAPVLLASWLAYRFVLHSSERARAMRLLGRAVPHV